MEQSGIQKFDIYSVRKEKESHGKQKRGYACFFMHFSSHSINGVYHVHIPAGFCPQSKL